jgi:hypothetical protein
MRPVLQDDRSGLTAASATRVMSLLRSLQALAA